MEIEKLWQFFFNSPHSKLIINNKSILFVVSSKIQTQQNLEIILNWKTFDRIRNFSFFRRLK